VAKRVNKTAAFAQSEPSWSVPAAEVFSFLKEMSGEVSWSLDGMAKSLKIPLAETKRIAEVFKLQGYIKKEASGAWITTGSGEEVSGAKLPRYTAKHIEDSLKALRERIDQINRDKNSEFKITQAVAFGDFLHGRSRLQAADVGIALEPRGADDSHQGKQRAGTRKFLQRLRARITALNLVPFEPWMAARWHRSLV
jgi:hypothetical protein